MPRPRKYIDSKERHRVYNTKRRGAPLSTIPKFIAIDGEGEGEGDSHRYVLLSVGDRSITNPGGLGFLEIVEFLWAEFERNPGAVFCGFYLVYDFAQWLKSLPEERARRLLTVEGRASRARNIKHLHPFPVEYQGWEFDFLAFKRMRLRKEGAKQWMYINDAGSFFQASFLSVIDPAKWTKPICSNEEYSEIYKGKSKRSTAHLGPDMLYYNQLENRIMSRLMHELAVGLSEIGIYLRRDQWFGPGQAAQAWLSQQPGLITAQDIPDYVPEEWIEAARRTYYGGWFEIFAHGIIPGQSWEYDINSAYPYACLSLPCLLHGKWYKGMGNPGDLGADALCIVKAQLSGSNPILGSMLHRTAKGSILRPNSTRGYYWKHEIDAAKRCGAIDDIRYDDCWIYEPCPCKSPFKGLSDLYEIRLKVGKDSPLGKACKLIYNSVYGKLAQSIGNPKFGNAIYASLITSKCRTMILDAIATHPDGAESLLMVATDGVYFRTPHPGLRLSKTLGEWDSVSRTNLTLFKPGVYWDDRARTAIRKGTSPSFKARGVSAKYFAQHLSAIDSEFSLWSENQSEYRYPAIRFQSEFSMVSPLQALQRNDWSLCGRVGTQELSQDSDPYEKRTNLKRAGDIFRTSPYPDGGPVFESTPYSERFGQPDPEEYGYNPDGLVLDGWTAALGLR